MIDLKKLAGMGKERQLDIIKCKLEIVREAYEQSEGDSDAVRQVLAQYLAECEKTLEKAAWSLS